MYDGIYRDVSQNHNPGRHGNEENARSEALAGAEEVQEQR
jgi:hypothetical protein